MRLHASQKLELAAEKSGVSFNAEITRRLEESFASAELGAIVREAVQEAFAAERDI